MQEVNFQTVEASLGIIIPQEVKSFYKLYDIESFDIELCDEEIMMDFENILDVLGINTREKLLPILHHHENDFVAIYLSGDLKGMICLIDHEEPDISPKYTSTLNLIKAIKDQVIKIEKGEDLIEFYDLEAELPRFGKEKYETDFTKLKKKLFATYTSSSDPELKSDIAFNILAFVDERDYRFIKKHLLHSDNMWIQAAVINTIKRKLKDEYLADIFSILKSEKVNPLIETTIMIRETMSLQGSRWEKEFKLRFPEVAKSYLEV